MKKIQKRLNKLDVKPESTVSTDNYEMDNNEKRAKKILEKFGFNFKQEYGNEIRQLLNEEIDNYQEGSSEYLRVLCGFLFCIGDPADIELIKKAKYKINMDVGCMINGEWIDSMENATVDYDIRERGELIEDYIEYYKHYFHL